MINDLKELKSLFALCRKQGVTEIKVGECHVKFGHLDSQRRTDEKEDDGDSVSFDDLTPEQQMFLSVDGIPG